MAWLQVKKPLNHSRILWAHCKHLPPILSDWEILKNGILFNWCFEQFRIWEVVPITRECHLRKWVVENGHLILDSEFGQRGPSQRSMSNPCSRTPFISGLWSFLLPHEGILCYWLEAKFTGHLSALKNSETKWLLIVSLQEKIGCFKYFPERTHFFPDPWNKANNSREDSSGYIYYLKNLMKQNIASFYIFWLCRSWCHQKWNTQLVRMLFFILFIASFCFMNAPSRACLFSGFPCCCDCYFG